MLHLKTQKLLKDCSLAVTKNRSKVLSFFLKEDKPIDLKTIKSKFKDLDRVTLFRILSIFEKNKLIHSIVLDNGKKYFALCNQECVDLDNHNHNHVHFVCEKCNDVLCLDIEDFPKLSVPNYLFKDISVNVSGLCSNCN
tara:strand:+ start:104 stop:520 length:417 start_codon:yes stop_codon:yes gene_type:complete